MPDPIKPDTKINYHTADGDYPGKVIAATYPDTLEEYVDDPNRPEDIGHIQIGGALGDRTTKRPHPQAGQQMMAPVYKDEYDNELGGERMATIEYVQGNGHRVRVRAPEGTYHGMFSIAE